MKRRYISILLLAVVLLPALCVSQVLADGTYSMEAFCEKYRSMYGYSDTDEACGPTFLDYVGFAGTIPLDGGMAGVMRYSLHGGVSGERIKDYIAYLSRFVYQVNQDTVQNGIRLVETKNESAPDCLPVTFRFYYDPNDQSIVTAYSALSGKAYDALCRERAEAFAPELGTTKTLGVGASITLSGMLAVSSLETERTCDPFMNDAPMSLVKEYVRLPVPVKKPDDHTSLAVISIKEDASIQGFWLVRLQIHTARPMKTSYLEFCIAADDVIVAFPFLLAGGILDDGGVMQLMDGPTVLQEGNHTLWLAFPALPAYGKIRLYASFSADHTPLLERLSFGLAAWEE